MVEHIFMYFIHFYIYFIYFYLLCLQVNFKMCALHVKADLIT